MQTNPKKQDMVREVAFPPRDGQQGWDSAGFTSWHSKATQALLESGRGMARATVTILGSRTHAFPFHGDKGAVSICLLLPLQGQA